MMGHVMFSFNLKLTYYNLLLLNKVRNLIRTDMIMYNWLIDNVGIDEGWSIGDMTNDGGFIIFDNENEAVAFKIMFAEYIINDRS